MARNPAVTLRVAGVSVIVITLLPSNGSFCKLVLNVSGASPICAVGTDAHCDSAAWIAPIGLLFGVITTWPFALVAPATMLEFTCQWIFMLSVRWIGVPIVRLVV